MSVIPPTVCVVLTIYVLLLGWNERGIRVFVILLLVLTAYGVVQVIIQNQHDIDGVASLSMIRTALWGLIAPLSYHTVLALMKDRTKMRKFVLGYLYVFGAGLIILLFSGYTIFNGYYHAWWGWGAVMNPRSWFFWAFHAYLLSGVLALVATLFMIRQQTENYRVQKLAQAILVNFVWGGIFTVVPYTILSWFKLPAEIFLSYAGNVAAFLIVLAIQKYHPEKLSAKSLLSNLSSFLPNEALMLTPEKKILWLNRAKISFNGFTPRDLEGAGYEKVFANTAMVDQEMNKIRTDPNYSSSFETECNTSHGTNISVRVSISGLRNEFNDVIAYLVVYNERSHNTSLLEHLQTSYNLSDREKEVAALLLDQYSNLQISDRLFISLNTVKTHTRNIYQKTSTTNRQDFRNLCSNFTK